MNVIEKSLFSLIDEFIGNGGGVVSSEIKPLSDAELDSIQKLLDRRLSAPERALLRWTGGDWSSFKDQPLHRVNFIPDFFVLKPDSIIYYHEEFRGTDNLGTLSLPKSLRGDANACVPVLSSGVDFISLLAKGDSCGLVLKRNDHSVASEFWPSIHAFLDFTRKAWQMNIYRINEKEEFVEFDIDRLTSIMPTSVVHFGGEGY